MKFSLITVYQLSNGNSPQECLMAKFKSATLLTLLYIPTLFCLMTSHLLSTRGAQLKKLMVLLMCSTLGCVDLCFIGVFPKKKRVLRQGKINTAYPN